MRRFTLIIVASCLMLFALMVGLKKREQYIADEAYVAQFASYENRDGEAEAESDWAKGAPRWITYGGPPFDLRPGANMLQEKLAITRDQITWCVTTPAITCYTKKYNHVIWQKLVDLYGEEYVRNTLRLADVYPRDFEKEANQAPLPTTTAVTPRAGHESSQP